MNFENLSESEIKTMEEEIAARRSEVSPTYEHHGPVESLSDNEIKILEAQVAAKRSEVSPTYEHHGPVESLSDNEIKILEAQVAASRREISPTYQHYGSVENLGESEIKILEAQVAERRQTVLPYKEYFKNLITNPTIADVTEFEVAVKRSMESNGLMNDFMRGLSAEISKESFAFRGIDKTDTVAIQKQKQRIESLVSVYVKYLYTLKNNGWAFYGPGNSIGLETLDSASLDELYKTQRNFEVTFTMPIPKDLGEDYGKAFERQGHMIPGFTLMYDDLKNKEVNWHQVMIYRENELTPRQKYLQRKQEAAKQFEMARQEELKKAIEEAKKQALQNGTPQPTIEQETISIRR